MTGLNDLMSGKQKTGPKPKQRERGSTTRVTKNGDHGWRFICSEFEKNYPTRKEAYAAKAEYENKCALYDRFIFGL